jgi:hypothetical protein
MQMWLATEYAQTGATKASKSRIVAKSSGVSIAKNDKRILTALPVTAECKIDVLCEFTGLEPPARPGLSSGAVKLKALALNL